MVPLMASKNITMWAQALLHWIMVQGSRVFVSGRHL